MSKKRKKEEKNYPAIRPGNKACSCVCSGICCNPLESAENKNLNKMKKKSDGSNAKHQDMVINSTQTFA